MSSIYDNKKNVELLDGGTTSPSKVSQSPISQLDNDKEEASLQANVEVLPMQPSEEQLLDKKNQELASYQERSSRAMELVDDIVLKNYLTKLSLLEVVPCNNQSTDDIILFKINKMVYEKDEYATDKFISVVSAMTYTNSSIYLIVDGHESHTDFYLGVKSEDENRQKSTIAETFKSSFLGQFPGAEIEDYSFVEVNSERSRQDKLLHRITEAVSVSSCVGIPSYKNSKGEYTNANFIQGIEKFASAMQGKNYTAVILASNMPKSEIEMLRNGYETVYTELSAMATRQLAYSTNESLANAISRTKGTSDTHTVSLAEGVSDGTSHTDSIATSSAHAKSHTEGESKDNAFGKASKGAMGVGGAMAGVGMALTATGVGAVVGVPLMVGGAVVGGVGSLLGIGAKNKSKSDTETFTTTESYTSSEGVTHTKSSTTTVSDAHTDSFNETNGETSTVGTSKNFTITIQNKHIVEVQKRIDKQLERIEMCESTGLWSTGAYFMSYDTDRSIAEISASIFRSIMQGDQSGVETSALNTWYDNEKSFKPILQYVGSLSHPIFKYDDKVLCSQMALPPTSLLSSKELSIMIGLPRKSVPGLPVIEHISMGKEVVKLNKSNSVEQLQLGCIFDQGIERKDNKVYLDTKSLTQHTFVTGSTGCGKSNTIYHMISQIQKQPESPKFLIIEPAKGEYKDVFGDWHVYGTNPLISNLLNINPFRFPCGVHVLEHIDRLIEIFNVCWPMYAAMPAVLKDSMIKAYEHCGWDMCLSKCNYSKIIYPNFMDLQNELISTISSSAYSEEVKSNYSGALVTRVKSLCNGINKYIFSANEIGDKCLFDDNVIIDLSRIGSQETKALIMGILIMRLNEYRSNSNIERNSNLRHVTVLEEAHNILKRCSTEQSMDGANVVGKSVEMITNSIAEMRTYGEGFIIVDQSPGAVDISAIRNTNTKILMRLPEEQDRVVAGKSAAMKNEQIDEIAKLPTGVAVVYQNNWEEPVLCKIDGYVGQDVHYKFQPDNFMVNNDSFNTDPTAEILKLLLLKRVNYSPDKIDISVIDKCVKKLSLSALTMYKLSEMVREYEETGDSKLWEDSRFEELSMIVSEIIPIEDKINFIFGSALDINSFNIKLRKIVQESCPLLPQEYFKELSHCIMCKFSMSSEMNFRMYSAWYQEFKKI